MQVVFSKQDCSVRFDGAVVRLSKGQAWGASHPFVVARPEFFTDDLAILGDRVGPTGTGRVEQATANPGEKRAARAR